MLDLLAGIQMARRATEGQFVENDRARPERRPRRPLLHVPLFLRRSPGADRSERRRAPVGRADAC